MDKIVSDDLKEWAFVRPALTTYEEKQSFLHILKTTIMDNL